MTKISKVVTVALLTNGIQASQVCFGHDAEDAFPESPYLTAFFDENNQLVGLGDENDSFRLNKSISGENIKKMELLAPFLSAHEALEWLFNPDEVPVTDGCRPDSQNSTSVCFTWSGDARDLESCLMEEEPDDWEDELETFKAMLDDPNTLAVGWKYVRECDWTVRSDSELNQCYDEANWDALGEGCFVIQKY